MHTQKQRGHSADSLEDIGHTIVAWIAAPPSFRDNTESIELLIDDLLDVLKPFQVSLMQTTEPRIYRTTAHGRALLSEALRAQCVGRIWFGEPVSPYIHLGRGLSDPVIVSLTVGSLIPHEQRELVAKVSAFAKRWFVSMDAASAFVSNRQESTTRTSYEIEHQRSVPVDWSEVRCHFRGAFWGNALGQDLCTILGGLESVIKNAPVQLAEPLGNGVWLQVTEEFSPSRKELGRLSDYLAPILEWPLADSEREQKRKSAQLRVVRISEDMAFLSNPLLPSRDTPLIPTRELENPYDQDDVYLVFNIYFGQPLVPSQRDVLISALHAWFHAGQHGEYGGGRLRSMSEPAINGVAARFSVDITYADRMSSIDALRRQLSSFAELGVREIVVGIEKVG